MKNTTDTNPERRCDTGFASLRNASPQNVSGVRTRGEIQQNSRNQKQSEIVNAEHGEVVTALIGVPVFRDHAIFDTKHVEPERLVMLAVTACPRLAHIDDDYVLVPNRIQ
jgi:hypothetical protein